MLIMGPISGFLAVFAHPLLSTWIGSGFAADAALPLRLLAVAALFVALSAPPADVARGLGKPGWVLGYTLAAAVIGIGVSIPAVDRWGADGAALGLLVGLTVTTPVFLLAVAARLLREGVTAFFASLAGPLVATLAVTVTWTMAYFVNDGFLMAIAAGGCGAAATPTWPGGSCSARVNGTPCGRGSPVCARVPAR